MNYACPKGAIYQDVFIYIKFYISMSRLDYTYQDLHTRKTTFQYTYQDLRKTIMQRAMQSEMSHLEHFFEEFLKTLHEETEVLNGQQCEPNRANSLLYPLRDFEITLGLISSQELHYRAL